MKIADRVTGVILIILGAVVWLYSTNNIKVDPLSVIDAAFLPRFIGIGLILAGVILFMATYRGKSNEDEKVTFHKKEATIILMFVIFIVLLPFIGYLILTPILLIVVSSFVGEGKFISKIAPSIIITAGIYIVFKYLLSVPIPTGTLF